MENNSNIGNSNTKVLLIIIGIMLVGIIVYLGYEKMTCEANNKDTENSKECEVCKTVTNEFDMETLDRIGRWFYWLGEDKIDNMNNINNDLKFYIAANDLEIDIDEQDNTMGYSTVIIDASLKKIFGDNVTIQRKNITNNGYGSCGTHLEYSSEKGGYIHGPYGCIGPMPVVIKKITKIASYDKYFEVYIKAAYEDTFELNDLQIDELINNGKTFKLTFNMSDNGPIWTKYEVIK